MKAGFGRTCNSKFAHAILNSCESNTAGVIAQLGERFNGIEEVGGSIPPGSTTGVTEAGRRERR